MHYGLAIARPGAARRHLAIRKRGASRGSSGSGSGGSVSEETETDTETETDPEVSGDAFGVVPLVALIPLGVAIVQAVPVLLTKVRANHAKRHPGDKRPAHRSGDSVAAPILDALSAVAQGGAAFADSPAGRALITNLSSPGPSGLSSVPPSLHGDPMFYGSDGPRPPLWLLRERAMRAHREQHHPAMPGGRPDLAALLPAEAALLGPFAPLLADPRARNVLAKLFRCPITGALKAVDQFGNEATIAEDDGYGGDYGADYGEDFGALPRVGGRMGLDRVQPMKDYGEAYTPSNVPPGPGRLTEIPMYQSGASTPRNAFTIAGGGTAAAVNVFSENASYLDYRVVGFRATVVSSDNSMGTVEDFKAQGTPNLFPHENAADARQYQTTNDHLVGLRFQPVIRSPNQTQVSTAAIGNNAATVVVTCATVAEILSDDLFGKRKPGPYARSA